MKKVIIIFLAVGLILSCKLLDQKDDQKADIRINVSLNNTEIDEAILVIYDIDYSYTTVSNNYENKNIHFSFPSTNFEKYWVTGVEDELDNLSNNNCAVESRQDLSISNIEAIGNFEIEAGIKYFLVGLFSNNNLVSTGYSDIVELQSGELKTINISPYKINTAPKAFFSIDPPTVQLQQYSRLMQEGAVIMRMCHQH